MPDNTAVIEILYRTAGVADVKAATAAVRESDTAAKTVNATVRETATAHTNALGMSRREWMRTGSEATYYASLMASKVGAAGGEISKVTGLVTQLGESFMFGGGVGIGVAVVGTVISAIIGKFQELEREAQAARDKVVESFNDINKALSSYAEPSVFDKISEQTGIAATSIETFAKSSKAAAQDLKNYETRLAAVAVLERDLASAQEKRQDVLASFNQPLTDTTRTILLEQLKDIEGEMSKYVIAIGQLTDANDTLLISERILNATIKEEKQEWREGAQALREYREELEKTAQAAAVKVAQFVKSQVASAVGGIIKPTSVSGEDQRRNDLLAQLPDLYRKANQAAEQGKNGLLTQTNSQIDAINRELAALGPYQEKWDEIARQADIIARDGAGRLAEFPNLAEALKKSGLDPKTFAEQFRSGALFADMKPEDLLGGAGGGVEKLAKDAMDKLKETIGTQKLNKAVSDKVFETMPKSMKDALKDMGIETLTDAEKVAIGVKKDKGFDKAMQALIDDILSYFPIDITVSAKAPQGGSPARPPGEYGGGGGGGTNPAVYEDTGGIGTLARDTLFQAHRGESFWFSGTRNQVPPPAQTVTVNAQVANGIDIERLAYRLAQAIQRHK